MVCCGMLCLVLWCGVCVRCVVRDALNNPCVHSTRPRVYVQTSPVYQHHAWCRDTRGRFERTHGDVLNGHTGAVRVIVSSAYQNLPTYGLSRASEVHQRNPWILHILRMGRTQSLNAPLLPVAMYSSYETGTFFRLFVQRPSRHFFLALSSSFYFSMMMQ